MQSNKTPTDWVGSIEGYSDYNTSKRFVLYIIAHEQPIGTAKLGVLTGTTRRHMSNITSQLKTDGALTSHRDPSDPRRDLFEIVEG